MNAPATPAAVAATLAEPKMELIPVAAICPSETQIQQLRRKRYDMESLANLTASVAKLGVQQPGVVRKLKAMRGLASYELVAGERRWRATRQAGLHHFPAIIRELDDTQVLEVQLVENIQRETLHPLEEAVGYEELMKTGQLKAEAIGGKVGLSRSWVYSRLNLLKLDGEARKALEDGRLDVSRALVVASVAQPNQRAEALRLALETGYGDKPVYSVRELRAKIQSDRLTMPLRGAPFDMSDATVLPDMGACGPCRFRAGNCDPETLDPDICTNLACFHLKVKAQGERTRQAVLDAGGKVLRGDEARKLSPSVKTVYDHVDLDAVCGADDFPEERPTPQALGIDEDADNADELYENHPAVIAWNEREALWQSRTYRALLEGEKYKPVVIEDPKTKAVRELLPFREAQRLLKKVGIELPNWCNRKRPSPTRNAGANKAAETRAANQRAKEELARQREAEFRQRVLKAAFPKIKATLTKDVLRTLAEPVLDDHGDEVELLFGHCDLRKLTEADLVRLLIAQSALADVGHYAWGKGQRLLELAKSVKVDTAAIRKQVTKDVTAPAGEQEDEQ